MGSVVYRCCLPLPSPHGSPASLQAHTQLRVSRSPTSDGVTRRLEEGEDSYFVNLGPRDCLPNKNISQSK